jgi:lipooligosaccharide transport system permease protein
MESSWPINGKMIWHRNYDAMTATPMRIVDIVIGELGWIAVRLLILATVYTIVLALFGAARSSVVVTAIPAAMLTGLAVAAPVMAYAATLVKGANFNALHRFVVMPLFLFSGTFFPVTRLPVALQYLATLTPLYHGVELTRGLVLQTLTWQSGLVHTAYLVALCVGGCAAAVMTFTRRLSV